MATESFSENYFPQKRMEFNKEIITLASMNYLDATTPRNSFKMHTESIVFHAQLYAYFIYVSRFDYQSSGQTRRVFTILRNERNV